MSIHQLIAAINPDVFCERSVRLEIKRILESAETGGDTRTMGERQAWPFQSSQIDSPSNLSNSKIHFAGFRSPTERHTLSYDSFDESLEAFYFWLLDELTADGRAIHKLADTFAATPASGLFSDLSRRETTAQREVLKLLRDAHNLVRDIQRGAAFLKEEAGRIETNEAADKSGYHIERSLLRSKIETLKLLAWWLGPYLRQARQTRQNDGGGAALVNLFNTATAEITLLAQKEYPVGEDVDRGALPKFFLKAGQRDIFSVWIVELKLRAAPERTSPGAYGDSGRFELTLTSYALNDDELTLLRRELDREDLNEVIHSVGETNVNLLNNLVKEMDALVAEPKQSAPAVNDPNPLTALFDFSDWFGGSEASDGSEVVVPLRADSEIEAVIRSQALLEARRRCLEFYTRCKHSLSMPCFG